MMQMRFLSAAALGFALTLVPCAASAQSAPAETSSQTDSGVIVAPGKERRIPLDQFMEPLRCPDDEICIEGEDEPEADRPPPEPGDRKLDAAAERRALSTLGNESLPTECSAIGPGGASACAFDVYNDYDDDRDLMDARVLPPEDPER